MERNAQATRERILNAAFAEFAAKGLAGGRIDSIAAAAGFNKSLIFVHFKSKSALFERVVELQLDRLADAINVARPSLSAVAAKICDFATDNPDVMRLFAWHGLENGIRSPAELLKMAGDQLETSDCVLLAEDSGTTVLRDILLSTAMSLGMGWSSFSTIRERLDCGALDVRNGATIAAA